ncbi:DUF1348 family protein [Yaniella sp.]|uniref:DUF1348 family protein n=1 Tax=Yaniella sp. TaxID=2773929 RepID=UPI0034618E84
MGNRCCTRYAPCRKYDLCFSGEHENWEFDNVGLMPSQHASINDPVITDSERKFH